SKGAWRYSAVGDGPVVADGRSAGAPVAARRESAVAFGRCFSSANDLYSPIPSTTASATRSRHSGEPINVLSGPFDTKPHSTNTAGTVETRRTAKRACFKPRSIVGTCPSNEW